MIPRFSTFMRAPFEDLRVWQTAQKLAVEIYRTTEHFPASERYSLSAQLRRAAISVSANIAEGNARRFRREYIQACYVARGSIAEVKSLLNPGFRLGFLAHPDYCALLEGYNNAGRMLQRLIARLDDTAKG